MKITIVVLTSVITTFLLSIFFHSFTNRSTAQKIPCEATSWRLVYQHDIHGKPLQGAKNELFDAVRRGDPIRFAWGATVTTNRTYSVEHSAEPVFLTIVNENELFAQMPEHILQQAYALEEKSRFDKPSVLWRGLMGTDGTFDAVWVDRATGQTVMRKPQRAQISWFAQSPPPSCDSRKPIKLNVSNGVILDEKPSEK